MNDKYLTLEGRLNTMQFNISQLFERILRKLHNSTSNRMKKVLELVVFDSANELATKPKKNRKAACATCRFGPIHTTMYSVILLSSYNKVQILSSFATYQKICFNAHSLLQNKPGHQVLFSTSNAEFLGSLDVCNVFPFSLWIVQNTSCTK